MLLKIYTSQNTVKIIDQITDAEIHQGEWAPETYQQMTDSVSFGPGVLRATRLSPEVDSYDFDISSPHQTMPVNSPLGSIIKYIDYEKSGIWRRAAIRQYAYLCNDEGKTIAKIGA